jgi:undecaprenyl-diphosphatase
MKPVPTAIWFAKVIAVMLFGGEPQCHINGIELTLLSHCKDPKRAPEGRMNSFDANVVVFFNNLIVQHHWIGVIAKLNYSTRLLEGGVVVLFIWLALFDRKRPGQLQEGFELLLGSIFWSMFAVLTARALAFSLPFRARPLATPSLDLYLPYASSIRLINWSAFPSDHATLYFGLVAGVLMVSRKLGGMALAWTFTFGCMPLLFLGVHWPTDLLGGAVLGFSFAQLARIPAFREFSRRTITNLYQNQPRIFFVVLFFWSYETVGLYEDIRHVLKRIALLYFV